MAQAREKIHIDLDDIEQLFGLVEISHRLGDIGSETRKSMVYLIAKTLQMSIDSHRGKTPRFAASIPENFLNRFSKNGYPYIVEGSLLRIDMYEYFAALLAGIFDDPQKRQFRRDTIITFNYDLVCEHSLRRFGLLAAGKRGPMNRLYFLRELKICADEHGVRLGHKALAALATCADPKHGKDGLDPGTLGAIFAISRYVVANVLRRTRLPASSTAYS